MTARQFFDLTAKVRDKQREYYANKAHGINDLRLLNECKQLEKQLDAEILRVRQIINKSPVQQTLNL